MQLVPEIEASLREETPARSLFIDHLIQEALALHRKESPMLVRSGYLERHRELAWEQKPDMRFLGEWVADLLATYSSLTSQPVVRPVSQRDFRSQLPQKSRHFSSAR